MDFPLEHLPREQLVVLMSRIAAILAQPAGPVVQQTPRQMNQPEGSRTRGLAGCRPGPMPTAESWNLKDDPWNRHLLEGTALPAAFGRVCYGTAKPNIGDPMQASVHCPGGGAGYFGATMPGLCKQSSINGSSTTPLIFAERSEKQHFAPTCAGFGAHTCSVQTQVLPGGGNAGDHDCSNRGPYGIITGAEWLDKHELSHTGMLANDGTIAGSSNDVQACTRRDVDPASSSATVFVQSVNSEPFEDCSAMCRECNAKCCLRRRGHSNHRCLYHKFP